MFNLAYIGFAATTPATATVKSIVGDLRPDATIRAAYKKVPTRFEKATIWYSIFDAGTEVGSLVNLGKTAAYLVGSTIREVKTGKKLFDVAYPDTNGDCDYQDAKPWDVQLHILEKDGFTVGDFAEFHDDHKYFRQRNGMYKSAAVWPGTGEVWLVHSTEAQSLLETIAQISCHIGLGKRTKPLIKQMRAQRETAKLAGWIN